jgi:hypothetical protein
MEPITKTLIIKKKGRKYFDCVIGGYKAKVLINEISKDLGIDRVVKLHVNDLSERNKYGTVLKFEPVAILDDRDAEALREAAKARNKAERWLSYAENDVKYGGNGTKAIANALLLCPKYEDMAERLAALKERVQNNSEAYEAQKKQWAKENAERAATQAKRRQMRVLFPHSMLPAMNTPVCHGNLVIVFESTGKSFRISEHHPSTEGGHLLGYEGEYGCYCYYREATAEEISALESQEAETQAKTETEKARNQAVETVKSQIIEYGERPDGWHDVDGERLFNTQDIYGGGSWFVITDAHIWYVRNNGMDGDNWSANNIRTGGAGAIGYRIPYSIELAEQLRELHN